MTAKEYLSQARYLDNRIKSKLLQIDSLNELATRCTPSYSDMPKSPNREGSRMESAILDIIELEDEISKDVVELVALKKEIVEVIKQVGNTEYQTLLEERYLCFITWEQIAVDMGYELRYIHKLHGKALSSSDIIILAKVRIAESLVGRVLQGFSYTQTEGGIRCQENQNVPAPIPVALI